MLFDLRGRGRRRTVQVIYATLAILLGGGLVFFGIGGDVQGGLFDAFKGGGGGGDTDIQEDEAKDAREAARANPRDARAWAVLAEKEYALARVSDGLKTVAVEGGGSRLEFTGEARQHALEAERAWDRHVQIVGQSDKADGEVAATMEQFFSAFDKPDKAFRAQEAVIASRGENVGYGDFAKAATLAYAAGPNFTRQGDLNRRAALTRAREQKADPATIDELKRGIDAAKAQAEQEAAQGATGGTAATP